MSDDGGDRKLLGVGAAACAACCAPLVPGLLAGLGLTGLAWATVGVGLAVALGAIVVAVLVVRRRRARRDDACRTPVDTTIAVADPVRRATEARR